MANSPKNMSLVADIGGTNTRVALAQGHAVIEGSIARYRNADYSNLSDILEAYIADRDTRVSAACVAIAGPVRDGRAEMTNLSWVFDCDALRAATGADRTAILNDLQAQGYALSHMPQKNIAQIIVGETNGKPSSALVIGLGTGVNIASVLQTENGLFSPPAEAGHISLPVYHPDDLDLADFIAIEHGFAAVEDALSGRGLEHLYAFHAAQTSQTVDIRAAEVMERIKAGDDEIAQQAGRHYVRSLGGFCGDMALVHLPFGGIYLVGGVARAIAPYLKQFDFEKAFKAKGRFEDFLTEFSVSLVEDDYAALTGCAAFIDPNG